MRYSGSLLDVSASTLVQSLPGYQQQDLKRYEGILYEGMNDITEVVFPPRSRDPIHDRTTDYRRDVVMPIISHMVVADWYVARDTGFPKLPPGTPIDPVLSTTVAGIIAEDGLGSREPRDAQKFMKAAVGLSGLHITVVGPDPEPGSLELARATDNLRTAVEGIAQYFVRPLAMGRR
jgi:hypothetical protein